MPTLDTYKHQVHKYNNKLQKYKKNIIVHFIRHAESTANKAAKTNINEYDSEKWFDAELTLTGIEQAKKLQNYKIKPDLVYTSPFRRTIATMYYSLALLNINNLPIIVDKKIGEIQNGHPCNYYGTDVQIYNRNIETEKDIINRGESWFHDMVTYVKDKPNIKNVFVYTHSVFMYEFLNNSSLLLNHNCRGFPENTQVCSVNIQKFL